MKRMIKYAATASVAGMFALGMALPSQATPARTAAVGYGTGTPAVINTAYYYGGNYDHATYGHMLRRAPGYSSYDYVPEANTTEGQSSCVQPGFYHRKNYTACY